MLFFENLINKPVLDVDAAGICSFKITLKLLKWRRVLERVIRQQCEQLFGLRSKAGRGKTASILLSLFGVDDLPRRRQPGSFSHSSTGVASPSRMDSRMPGTDRR
jgi:hypothetical protein